MKSQSLKTLGTVIVSLLVGILLAYLFLKNGPNDAGQNGSVTPTPRFSGTGGEYFSGTGGVYVPVTLAPDTLFSSPSPIPSQPPQNFASYVSGQPIALTMGVPNVLDETAPLTFHVAVEAFSPSVVVTPDPGPTTPTTAPGPTGPTTAPGPTTNPSATRTAAPSPSGSAPPVELPTTPSDFQVAAGGKSTFTMTAPTVQSPQFVLVTISASNGTVSGRTYVGVVLVTIVPPPILPPSPLSAAPPKKASAP